LIWGTFRMRDSSGELFGLLVLAAIAAYVASSGWFYSTGRQWYEQCYARSVAEGDSFVAPVTKDPYQAVAWANCEDDARRAVFGTGFVFVGQISDVSTPAEHSLAEVCPSSWTDVPVGGVYLLALRTMQDSRRPNLLDRFLPASRTIAEAFSKRWPKCAGERLRLGFPRIVEVSPEILVGLSHAKFVARLTRHGRRRCTPI
jgi:hypothetical protein